MKNFLAIAVFLFLLISPSFAQWKKINAVPDNDIVSLVVHNDRIYAASNVNEIYKSADGIAWTSIRVSPDAIDISSIIFFDAKIYVGTFNWGVFFSSDNGDTWQNNGSGPSFISRFGIKNNSLYASTLGNGVAVLDSVTGKWSFLNNSLPSYSVNVQSVIGSASSLLIAAGSNGTFYRYDFNANEWNEEYYFGSLRPGLQIDRLVNSADTIWAVNGNSVIKSSNAGIQWDHDKIGTHDGTSRFISAGMHTYYTLTNLFPQGTWVQQRSKGAGIGSTWSVNEEFFPTGFSYDITEFGNKLFLGKDDGLYEKEVTGAALPIRFTSVTLTCENDHAVLKWKTARDATDNHYDVEKSIDGSIYRVIERIPATGSNSQLPNYSFTDNSAATNSSYRIAAYDSEGKVQYTQIFRPFCHKNGSFTFSPNPTRDIVRLNIISEETSLAEIKLYNGKGALMKLQRAILAKGSNQVEVSLKAFAKGIYNLSAVWNKAEIRKTIQVIKQ